MKVEIYMENPLAGGCGCGATLQERMQLVKSMNKQSEELQKLKKEFKGVEFTRDILKEKGGSYPTYVQEALNGGTDAPLVFIDSEPVITGRMPGLNEFRELVQSRLGA